MAVSTFTKSGSKATTAAKLDDTVFAVKIKNDELVRTAYEAYLANSRENYAVTKTRGLVRGGGRKPWAQKGTGRARFGSTRNPIWRTGGVVFGPTGHENYTIGINKKARRVAIRQALTMKATADAISVIEELNVTGKTADMSKLLVKLGANRRVLIATDVVTAELRRATSNLQNVKAVSGNYLNVFDILNADRIVITKKAMANIVEWLGASK